MQPPIKVVLLTNFVAVSAKIRLLDPQASFFPDHITPVEDLLEYIGGEELLPQVGYACYLPFGWFSIAVFNLYSTLVK